VISFYLLYGVFGNSENEETSEPTGTSANFLRNSKLVTPGAGISKNYCAKKSGFSMEVELRFCPWLILFKY
jgi:hypothetical protein